jgi:diguanylate cyclase (GGDEF)-like protein/PAS domain S-box-containing protein
MKARILIVEDERITALNIEQRLKQLGYDVIGNVASGEEAVTRADALRPDLTLMDIHLAGQMDGIDAAQVLRSQFDIPVIFLTAYADEPTLARAELNSPYGYLLKPFQPRELDATLRMALARHQSEIALRDSERRLKLAFDAVRMGSWEVDPVNGEFKRSGHTDELVGLDSNTLDATIAGFLADVVDEDRGALEALLHNTAADSDILRMEFRRRLPDGKIVWLKAEGKLFQLPEGSRLIGVLRDISADKQAEAKLRQAAEVFENTREAIFIADADAHIEAVNPAYARLTGYSANECRGKNWAVLQGSELMSMSLLQQLIDSGHWQGEMPVRNKHGELSPVWLNISVITDAQQRICNYIGVLTDISELRAAQEKLAQLAYFDTLTGLPNRQLLADRLHQEIERARRNKTHLALLYIDLDHFKHVNDTLGHEAGDACLKEMARRMKHVVREADTVARLAGDEFIVLLPDIELPEVAARVAVKLVDALIVPFTIGGHPVCLSASIGIAHYPGDGGDPGELMKAADIAMYDAKNHGRNRYRFYRSELSDHLSQVLDIEHRLRQALLNDELVLHYQPQVDELGRILSAEALIRWNEPGHGLRQPIEFLASAEEVGLMRDISNWVLDRACRQMAEWQAQKLTLTRIAVNIPPQVLADTRFLATLEQTLERYGLSSLDIEIELTEHAFQTGSECIATLEHLSRLGVSIAVDDFGMGFSCLNSLKQLPLASLKIDREFVKDMLTDPANAAIAETILTLARAHKLEVIAEGVETQAQHDFLVARGCTMFQGYLYSRALPATAFAELYHTLKPASARRDSSAA